jgi:hypothetical protein
MYFSKKTIVFAGFAKKNEKKFTYVTYWKYMYYKHRLKKYQRKMKKNLPISENSCIFASSNKEKNK